MRLSSPLYLGPSWRRNTAPSLVVARRPAVVFKTCRSYLSTSVAKRGDLFFACPRPRMVDRYEMLNVCGDGAIQSRYVRLATSQDLQFPAHLTCVDLDCPLSHFRRTRQRCRRNSGSVARDSKPSAKHFARNSVPCSQKFLPSARCRPLPSFGKSLHSGVARMHWILNEKSRAVCSLAPLLRSRRSCYPASGTVTVPEAKVSHPVFAVSRRSRRCRRPSSCSRRTIGRARFNRQRRLQDAAVFTEANTVAQPSAAALSAAVRRSVYVQVATIGLRCPDPEFNLLHKSRVSAPEVSRVPRDIGVI